MSQGKCGMTPKVGPLGGGGGRKSVNVSIGSLGVIVNLIALLTSRRDIQSELN